MDRVTHWLRDNRASRVPRRVVCFDSEAFITRTPNEENHSFRLACLSFDLLDTDGNPTRPPRFNNLDSPALFWEALVACTAQSHRTVAFAHNLGYDIRLTAALEHLPRLGFKVKGIGLNPHSCWARLSDGKRTLWLCDSHSFLPAKLERIGQLLRLNKTPLPEQDAPMAEWWQHCATDVHVLREAILHFLRLLRSEDWGDFRLTGSAQATACFRHRFVQPRTLLVHSDVEALAAERRAAFAGRCEVWRHGKIRGPIYEYDFTSAYASIAQRCDVPARLWGEHTLLSPQRLRNVRQYQAILADVRVRTDVPVVPAILNQRILWPVGEFRTTLWDCELDLLESEGGSYEIERLWIYDRAPVLRTWADYVLGALGGNPPGDDPIAALVLKHWSRALIGRFGLRYPSLAEWGIDDDYDLSMQPVIDAPSQVVTNHLQVGRQIFEQTGMIESPNSIPMLMSWIMAKSRCWLWVLMRTAGLENTLYVDTDGILTNEVGRRAIEIPGHFEQPYEVRRKGRWTNAEIRSPRNLDIDDERRITGVPRRAAKIRPSTFQAEVWESFPESLRRKRPATIVVSERMFSVSDRDPRRTHLADGHTEPVRLTIDTQAAPHTGEPLPLTAALSAP